MKYTAITIASFTFTSVTAFFPGFPGYAPPKAAQSNFLSEQIEVGTMSLSPLGFGTLNLPLDKTQDDANALDVMKTARAKGVNFIDTAEAYGFGKSESLTSWAAEEAGFTIGAAGVEDGCYIATKFAPVPWRPGAESVVQACQASAQRLGVDSIDLYQIHWPDIIQPLKSIGIEKRKDEQYWDGLAQCYHQGLAKNVGVSNYGPTMIKRAHKALADRGVPLVSNQINFSLVRYQSSLETIKVCEELGIQVLAYFPLGNGLLAGKYDLNDKSTLPTFPKSITMKKYLKGSQTLLQEVQTIATANNVSCAQVSLNWIMKKGVIPIPGCRNGAHALDNFASLDFVLSEEEVERLDVASMNSMEFSSGGFELE
uniref:NADP-dependent oxidoreductase domain-containing protein n=1 Tax=Ditylum brightwellii TaxID=49249 RepID=A0A7S4W2B6_9STRA